MNAQQISWQSAFWLQVAYSSKKRFRAWNVPNVLMASIGYTLMATHYMLIFLVYKWNFLPVGVFLFLIDSRSKMLSKGICFPDSGTIHKDTKAIICHSKMIFSFMPT